MTRSQSPSYASAARRLAGFAGAPVLALVVASPAFAKPQLAPIWGDHAVIQQGRAITVEGWADPGEGVQVTLGDVQRGAKAGKEGHFAVSFEARKASDTPLTLSVSGKDGLAARYSDLLVGDVWLCSGQSNMEFTESQALNAWNEAQSASDPDLRMITIPKAVSDHPERTFGGAVSWARTTPQTVGSFSAACYYMAKDLRKRLHIPIGTIHSSWGGSQSRPWLSVAGGRAIYGEAEMALLHRFATDPSGAVAQFAPRWEDWFRKQSDGEQPWSQPGVLTWQDVPSISPWNTWTGTPLGENPVRTVWLRSTITLTAEQAAGAAKLALGRLDDLDMTWVNGKAVGNTYGADIDRAYAVPAGYLHAGTNEIITALTNSWGGGGIVSGPETLFLTTAGGERIGLAKGLKYAISPVKAYPPRAPWDNQAGIGVMYNRMIAPIGHFALKGAAWYQGESDVGMPGYAGRLKALFAGWRAQFGQDMRMLVVQLANFGSAQTAPTASATADLREQQRIAVLNDSNAALVTAVDIGERTDIHPANKEEVGLRLAAAAVGEALPQPVAAVREGDTVRVRFSGVKGALHSWSGTQALSFELCGDDQASCRFASARPDGDSVILAGDGKPATRVRYGWADSPTLNLYDDRPMPPPAFELPVTPSL